MFENRDRSGDGILDRSGLSILIAVALALSNPCYAVDASSACEEESGIRVEADVVALTAESVTFRFSLENVSAEEIEVTQDLFPWLDVAKVSVVLLDWRSGGSFHEWVAGSKIRFDADEVDSKRNRVYAGSRRTRVIKKFVDSVGPVLRPGMPIDSDVTFYAPQSAFTLSESDLDRLRLEGVFLWTARITNGQVCLQSGISKMN